MRLIFSLVIAFFCYDALGQMDDYQKSLNDCNSRAQSLNEKLHQINGEYTRDVAEFRAGLFCSICKRSKRQIESYGTESFQQHLKTVKGHPVSASQAQMNELYQKYLEKWSSCYNDWQSAQGDCNSIRKEYNEAKFQEVMTNLSEAFKNSLPKVEEVKNQIKKYEEYKSKHYDRDVIGSKEASLTRDVVGDKVSEDNFDNVDLHDSKTDDDDPFLKYADQLLPKALEDVLDKPSSEMITSLKDIFTQTMEDFRSAENLSHGEIDENSAKRFSSASSRTGIIKAIQETSLHNIFAVHKEVERLSNSMFDHLDNPDPGEFNDWIFRRDKEQTSGNMIVEDHGWYNRRDLKAIAGGAAALIIGVTPGIVIAGALIYVLK